MTDLTGARLVVDPAIPAAGRAVLRAAPPGALVAAGLPAPAAPRLSPATIAARTIWIPLFALFYGVLPGGWITVFFLASLDEDDLLTSVFRWGRRAVLATLIVPALQVLLILLGLVPLAVALAAGSFAGWIIGTLRRLREAPRARAAREYHGRYLVAGDFDKPAAQLLSRAQRGIDTVLRSEVHRAGLLDDIDNTITLAHQEWEIASALAEHTRLRREQRAQCAERLSERVRALLEPQRRALDLSVRSVSQRVEALEAYARHARDADDAYHEWQLLQRLPAQHARYQDLLARTVRDDLAREEIGRLADDAHRAESTLRDSVGSALRAARAWAPVPPDSSPADRDVR